MSDQGKVVSGSARLTMTSTMKASLTSRYNFTGQFLRGSRILTARALELEQASAWPLSGDEEAEHRACVVGAVVQSAAALEAEIAVVLDHGPGAHLGSNGLDSAAKEILTPLAPVLEKAPTLEKYNAVLLILRKTPMEKGARPFQDGQLLVDVRNALVHYRSRWCGDPKVAKLNRQVASLRLAGPMGQSGVSLSPHTGWLIADLGRWSVETAEALVKSFYEHLGIRSPI